MYYVHRLVLDAFIGPEPGLQCNHKNGIRDDNRLGNLKRRQVEELYGITIEVL